MPVLFKKETRNFIKCLACSHYCRIADQNVGICGVRQNDKGRLKLLVYGRPCAVAVDPIEKKPLYNFLPETKIFSLGTFGCNLGCSFCQNWEMSQISRQSTVLSSKALCEKYLENFEYLEPKKIVYYVLKNNIQSIAYTYNEPTIWTEYAMDIAKIAKKRG